MFGFHLGNWFFGFAFVPIIWWAVGSSFNKKDRSAHSALDILRERYARGEISRQEFEEKKRDLENS